MGDLLQTIKQNQLPEVPKTDDGQTQTEHTPLIHRLQEAGMNKWLAAGVVVAGIAIGSRMEGLSNVAKAAGDLGKIAREGEVANVALGEARVFPKPELLRIERYMPPAPEAIDPNKMVMPKDVQKLYEKSFPVDEREPTMQVNAKLQEGTIRMYTVRDLDGNLGGFAFVSVHDDQTLGLIANQNPPHFVHLDFIATTENSPNPLFHRSNGTGTHFLQDIVKQLKAENVERVANGQRPFEAMSWEMEDPKAPWLTTDETADRNFRLKYYERQKGFNMLPSTTELDTTTGAEHFKPGYRILNFDDIEHPDKWNPVDDNQPAEWRMFWLTDQRRDPFEFANAFYQSGSGYDLTRIAQEHDIPVHPALQELRQLHGR